MARERNVGGLDRILRAILGALLVAVAVDALIDGRRLVAAALTVAGAGLLANATTGYCGLNAALGVDTCPTGSDDDRPAADASAD